MCVCLIPTFSAVVFCSLRSFALQLFLAWSFIPCVYLPTILNVWHVKWNFDRFEINRPSIYRSVVLCVYCVRACQYGCVRASARSVHLLHGIHRIYINRGPIQFTSTSHRSSHTLLCIQRWEIEIQRCPSSISKSLAWHCCVCACQRL